MVWCRGTSASAKSQGDLASTDHMILSHERFLMAMPPPLITWLAPPSVFTLRRARRKLDLVRSLRGAPASHHPYPQTQRDGTLHGRRTRPDTGRSPPRAMPIPPACLSQLPSGGACIRRRNGRRPAPGPVNARAPSRPAPSRPGHPRRAARAERPCENRPADGRLAVKGRQIRGWVDERDTRHDDAGKGRS